MAKKKTGKCPIVEKHFITIELPIEDLDVFVRILDAGEQHASFQADSGSVINDIEKVHKKIKNHIIQELLVHAEYLLGQLGARDK